MSDKILKLSQAQTLYQDLRQRIDALPTDSDIPEVPVQDVQVNGTSVLDAQGVANVPLANANTLGVVKSGTGVFVHATAGDLRLNPASVATVRQGTSGVYPLTPSLTDSVSFFGLAKAAGADMKDIANTTVGTYPSAQKAAIQSMLGISNLLAPIETTVASKAYSIGETFTSNGKLYKVTTALSLGDTIITQDAGATVSEHNAEETKISEYAVRDVQINGTSIMQNGVANVPIAGTTSTGAIRLASNSGLFMDGTILRIYKATDALIKSGDSSYFPIVPTNQNKSVFYGLAKAAGDTTQSQSSNAVGTYTNEAKAAIKSMIGVNVDDVQVNGVSVVSNGVANVPMASDNVFGVMKIMASNGIALDANNRAYIFNATSQIIKTGTNEVRPITPNRQQESVFYGLAKAAGDTTQAQSSNAVGTYTDSAKASIKSMLGVVDGSTGTVNVSGTTPTITAVENTRYVCGEIATLSFTPPASGISIVRFTSGTTATVLTLPSTVKFPEWFDPTTLEANTIYEMCITDGIYGAVMSWAL